MSNLQHHDSIRPPVRRRRERLLGVIAASTLFVSWYLSAALDARREHEVANRSQREVATAFDAAFIAANGLNDRRTIDCTAVSCPTQLAQTGVLQAQL